MSEESLQVRSSLKCECIFLNSMQTILNVIFVTGHAKLAISTRRARETTWSNTKYE